MNLTQVIHRITTDADFANQIRLNPEDALSQAGLTLEPDVLQALVDVLQNPARVGELLTNLGAGPDEPGWASMNMLCSEPNESGNL